MKKINLRGISEILGENEMKNVMGGEIGGGAGDDTDDHNIESSDYYDTAGGGGNGRPCNQPDILCDNKREYDDCRFKCTTGICRSVPFGGLVCQINFTNG